MSRASLTLLMLLSIGGKSQTEGILVHQIICLLVLCVTSALYFSQLASQVSEILSLAKKECLALENEA
jgi:hypothetical protein